MGDSVAPVGTARRGSSAQAGGNPERRAYRLLPPKNRLGLPYPAIMRVCLILAAAGPFLAYRLLPDTTPSSLVGFIAAVQAAAICTIASVRLAPPYRAALSASGFALAYAVTVSAELAPTTIGLAASGVCHAGAYAALLVWFACSLRPGQEPMVTALARRIRDTMPDAVIRYTRKVTIAWCMFFLAQLVVSATLLAAAPLHVWSFFVTTLNMPLIAAMVLGEFGLRWALFRNEPRTSLLHTLQAMRHTAGTSGHTP